MISIVYYADPFAHIRLRKIIYQHSLYVIAARNYVYAKKKRFGRKATEGCVSLG